MGVHPHCWVTGDMRCYASTSTSVVPTRILAQGIVGRWDVWSSRAADDYGMHRVPGPWTQRNAEVSCMTRISARDAFLHARFLLCVCHGRRIYLRCGDGKYIQKVALPVACVQPNADLSSVKMLVFLRAEDASRNGIYQTK